MTSGAQVSKENIEKSEFTKIKNFVHKVLCQNILPKEWKTMHRMWKKTANHISDKV